MIRTSCLLLALVCTPVLSEVPSGLASLDSATPGPGADVSGRSYRVGRLELAFTEGRLHPVLAGEEIVGGMFVGSARVTYRSADPLEKATLRTNLKRATKYAPDAPAVEDTVSKAILWDPVRVSKLLQDAELPEGEPPEKALNQFADVKSDFERLEWTAVDHLAYQIWRERPKEPAALVMLVGGKHSLLYEYDTIRSWQERLSLVRFPDFQSIHLEGTRFRDTLSIQAIGRSRLERPARRFMLSDVDLTFVNASGDHAVLDVRETLEILQPLQTVALGLWTRRITDVSRPYRVRTVELEDGRPLPFSHRSNEILVELPERVAAGTRLDLRFAVEGDILREDSTVDYWRIVGNWLPMAERLDCNAFTYHAIIKTGAPRIPFSNGSTVKRWKDESGLNCAEFRLDQPISYLTIIAGDYHTFSSEKNGIRVEVASYMADLKKRSARLANNAHGLLEFYDKVLGAYPFHELKIIEIDEYGWGQAPPGVIFITKEAFEPVLKSLGWSDGINRRLAHELAHTWWGHVAKWSNRDDQWLSESTAEYYAAFAMGQIMGPSEFKEAMAYWRRVGPPVKDRASLFLANQIAGDQAYGDRIALLYAKGPLVLHALRRELGDNEFFTLFKSFLTTFRMQHVETVEIVRMTEWLMKKDYSTWYDRYLFGVEWPEIEDGKGGGKQRKK